MTVTAERSTNGNGKLSEAHAAALAYLRAGLSVIPIRADGTKAPAVAWEDYQERLPTTEELQAWFGNGKGWGVGIPGGKVGGNVEHLDFDVDAATVFPEWCALVEAEAPGLLARLSIRQTPRTPPGYHVSYRCPEVEIPGNTKIAEAPHPSDQKKRVCLIETRGEGGQVLAPGCPPACHPSGGTYRHYSGVKLSHIQAITAAEREILWRAARSFDRLPPPENKTFRQRAADGLSPGDDYCARGPAWPELLEPARWKLVHQRGAVCYWQRPDKDGRGWSATTGACTSKDGRELFAVFSTNAHPFDGPSGGRQCSTHNRFAVYALLHHGGDFGAAAKALAAEGYGKQRQQQAPRTESTHTPPAPEVQPADEQPAKARHLIREFYRRWFCPTFRNDNAIYSATFGRLVALGDVRAGPPGELVNVLLAATDCPRLEDGQPKESSVPGLYRNWIGTAWTDLVGSLPTEEESVEVSECAKDDFRRLVAAVLHSIVAYGCTEKTRNGDERTEIQRRQIIEWCQLWAKPGPWAKVRSHLAWCRKSPQGVLEVAIQVGIFDQVGRKVKWSKTRFGQLCFLYGVGRSAVRTEGGQQERHVQLSPEFLAELLESPA
ncbi:MAG: bifunctional DNA primase/polymerase [Planctomycetia bacterium]|nr:bifunctional DNA primase/polymerase [Planctomycetia bacterium]